MNPPEPRAYPEGDPLPRCFVCYEQSISREGDCLNSACPSHEYMRAVCAWCRADLGERPGAGAVTHGICPPCLERARLSQDPVPLVIGRRVVATGTLAQVEDLVSALRERAGTLPHTSVRRCDGDARLTFVPCASTAGEPCDCGQALHARLLATAHVGRNRRRAPRGRRAKVRRRA